MTVAIKQGSLATRVTKPVPRIGERPDYIIRAGVENTFNVFHYQSQTQIQTNISTWYGDTQGVGDAPVAAGSLIEFEAGTHGERNFENFHGTYGNEIKFKASPYGQVVIRRNAGDASGGFVLYYANTKDIIIDGGPIIDSEGTILYGMKLLSALTGTDGPEDYLRINDNASSNTAGIPSGNITIRNIEVDGGWYTDGSGTLNGTGIGIKQTSTYFKRANHPGVIAENITIENCYTHNLENLGIQTGVSYNSGYIPYANVVINNCQIANTKKTGLEVHNSWFGTNRVHNNIITDGGNATGGTAQNPATGQFFGMSISSGKANVYNNKIYRSGEHTLRYRTASGPLTTDGVSSLVSYCYNNLLVEAGIPFGNTNPESVNDNGIDVNRTTVTNGVYPDVYIYNNTIAKCNGAAVSITSAATGNVRNNLLLDNVNGEVIGTPIASENNPTSAPVADIDNDDYTLIAPGTLVTGSTFSTVDIDGVTRDVGGEDCGAYEYLGGPISQTDADYTILAGTSDTFSVRRESDQSTIFTGTLWDALSTGVSAGDIIEFQSGTHGIRQITKLIGTAADKIKLRSPPQGKVIIRKASGTSGGNILNLSDSYHVEVDGSTTPGETYGILCTYATSGTDTPSVYMHITNSTYANNTVGAPTSNISVSNVEIDGGYPTVTSGNGICYTFDATFNRTDWGSTTVANTDLLLQNCYIHNVAAEGICIGEDYNNGKIALRHVDINNNIIANTGNKAVSIKNYWEGDNLIHNNNIKYAGANTDTTLGQHDGIAADSSTVQIYNNFIQWTGEVGIRTYFNQSPPSSFIASAEIFIFNNIIYGAGANNVATRSAGEAISMGTSNATTVSKIKPYVYNNTIVDASDRGILVASSNRYVSGGFIKNNIIVNNSPAWSPIILGAYDTITDNDTSNLVDISNNPTSASFADAANYDFSLVGQTLASGTIGVDITATDYAGVTREASYPDAGAYEYLGGSGGGGGGGGGGDLVVTPNTTAGENQGVSGPQYDEYSLADWRNYDDVVDGWDWSYPSSRLT